MKANGYKSYSESDCTEICLPLHMSPEIVIYISCLLDSKYKYLISDSSISPVEILRLAKHCSVADFKGGGGKKERSYLQTKDLHQLQQQKPRYHSPVLETW